MLRKKQNENDQSLSNTFDREPTHVKRPKKCNAEKNKYENSSDLCFDQDLFEPPADIVTSVCTKTVVRVTEASPHRRVVFRGPDSSFCNRRSFRRECVPPVLSPNVDGLLTNVPEPIPSSVTSLDESASVDDLPWDCLYNLKDLHRIADRFDLRFAGFEDSQSYPKQCF